MRAKLLEVETKWQFSGKITAYPLKYYNGLAIPRKQGDSRRFRSPSDTAPNMILCSDTAP